MLGVHETFQEMLWTRFIYDEIESNELRRDDIIIFTIVNICRGLFDLGVCEW